MKISLIGMSGVGKTYWSKQLEKEGFKRFGCDDLIEKKLGSELKKMGYSGIADVAKWMGQPFDKQYPQTSKKYLSFEKEIMEEILNKVQNDNSNENIVIDTTGSVIYAESTILQQLQKITKIVYLYTPLSVKKQMYDMYIQKPKPVIWGNSFAKRKQESNKEALERCYPKLLEYRTKKYEEIADITLSYSTLKDKTLTSNKFIELISYDIIPSEFRFYRDESRNLSHESQNTLLNEIPRLRSG